MVPVFQAHKSGMGRCEDDTNQRSWKTDVKDDDQERLSITGLNLSLSISGDD